MESIDLNYQHLIYLIGCSLHQKKPEKSIVRAIDFPSLCRAAVFHKVAALAANALQPYFSDRELMDEAVAEFWNDALGNSRRRATLMASECAAIGRDLDAAGIWFMPLKGSKLQNYYPVFGIREMNDVDILFDETRAADVRDIMQKRGYSVSKYDVLNHDVYEKPPVYELEMHKTLYREEFASLYRYYKNVKSRLVRKSSDSLEYAFTPEDFYIHVISHDCRDLHAHGIGLRQLSDIYLYNKNEVLDRAYVEAELNKLRIAGDEKLLRRLANQIYSEDFYPGKTGLSEADEKALSHLLSSGNSGTFENTVRNGINGDMDVFTKTKLPHRVRHKKLRYIGSRLFIKPEVYRTRDPFFYNHKWARPAYFFIRIFRVMTVKRKTLKRELKLIKDSKAAD